MSLKHKLETLDGLDEALKPLYAKGDDGKYTLQVDEAPATNAIAELKAKLKKAEDAIEAKEKADAKAKADAEEARARAEGDFEKLKANLAAKEAELLKQVEEAQGGLKSYLLKAELTQAIAANKGNPHLLKLVADQFEAVLSPDGAHKVLSKADPTKTPAQIIEGLKKDASYQAFFEGTGASGSGSGNSNGTLNNAHAAIFDPKSPSYNYTKQLELARDNPALFQALRTQFPETKQE